MAYVYTPYQKKEYQQGQGVQNAQAALEQHQQNKPGEYSSQWKQTMDDLIQKYQNRGPFQYDINADAMYQQMLDRYIGQGQQAMMDTVGQAAALTGGYGNSYAQIAGQQTYQNYLQGANDMLPQFYQMALDRYKMEGDDILSEYGLLSDQENTAYSRYMDQLNQYMAELDRLQGVYENEREYDYNKWLQDENFNYGMWKDDQDTRYQQDRDAISDERYNQEWLYQQERDRISDEQWQKEFEESQRQYNESMAWQREQAAAKSSGGGGGGGSSGSSKSGSIDVAAEYAKLRANGASGIESDRYLKAAIAAGLISERDATTLRDSRISQNRTGLSGR